MERIFFLLRCVYFGIREAIFQGEFSNLFGGTVNQRYRYFVFFFLLNYK